MSNLNPKQFMADHNADESNNYKILTCKRFTTKSGCKGIVYTEECEDGKVYVYQGIRVQRDESVPNGYWGAWRAEDGVACDDTLDNVCQGIDKHIERKNEVAKKKHDAAMAEMIREEQNFEMRAAFGPGVKVVNLISGERFIT